MQMKAGKLLSVFAQIHASCRRATGQTFFETQAEAAASSNRGRPGQSRQAEVHATHCPQGRALEFENFKGEVHRGRRQRRPRRRQPRWQPRRRKRSTPSCSTLRARAHSCSAAWPTRSSACRRHRPSLTLDLSVLEWNEGVGRVPLLCGWDMRFLAHGRRRPSIRPPLFQYPWETWESEACSCTTAGRCAPGPATRTALTLNAGWDL